MEIAFRWKRGGNQPIYDVDHASAHANVRVEIEILED